MKKLTKTQLKELETVTSALGAAFTELQDACEVYNDAKPEDKVANKVTVETVISEYNSKLSDVRSVCETIAAEIREFIDGKSEKWQQSDKATAYEAWAEEWEAELEDASWGTIASESKDGNGTITITLDTSDLEDYNETVNGYSIEVQE